MIVRVVITAYHTADEAAADIANNRHKVNIIIDKIRALVVQNQAWDHVAGASLTNIQPAQFSVNAEIVGNILCFVARLPIDVTLDVPWRQ